MTLKIIGSIALVLLTATASQAQNDTQTDRDPGTTGAHGVSGRGSDTGSIPPGWDGEIAKAFFLDPGAGTLRPEAHVRDNWGTLSAAQQDAVREHCSTAQEQPDGQEAAAEPEVTQGSLIRLCSWIAGM